MSQRKTRLESLSAWTFSRCARAHLFMVFFQTAGLLVCTKLQIMRLCINRSHFTTELQIHYVVALASQRIQLVCNVLRPASLHYPWWRVIMLDSRRLGISNLKNLTFKIVRRDVFNPYYAPGMGTQRWYLLDHWPDHTPDSGGSEFTRRTLKNIPKIIQITVCRKDKREKVSYERDFTAALF